MIIHPSSSHSQFNLKYDDLNSKLLQVKLESGMKRAVSTQSLFGDTRTFAEILDQEVEKIVLHYLRTQGELADRVWRLRETQVSSTATCSLSLNDVNRYLEKFREVAQDVLKMLVYLEWNVSKLKVIIKKHDRLYDRKIGSLYFDSKNNSQLIQLYHHDGTKIILATIRRGFEDVYEVKNALTFRDQDVGLDLEQIDDMYSRGTAFADFNASRRFVGLPKISYRNKLASFSNLRSLESPDPAGKGAPSTLASKSLDSNENSLEKRKRSKSILESLPFLSRGDSHGQPVKRSISSLEPLLNEMQRTADRILQIQQPTAAEIIASHSVMGLEFSGLDEEDEEARTQRKQRFLEKEQQENRRKRSLSYLIRSIPLKTTTIGLYINLFATFIFMANMYVVAPTSGHYAALLGMTPAVSGIIIGMTPLAVLASSVGYSFWTNYSFKSPLVVCMLCGLGGNLLYGMALQFNSLGMILAGRLLLGFGGTRVVSRRYIVDHVSAEDRVIASSQFVTAGAMGMAAGPLIASFIDRASVSFEWSVGALRLLIYRNETAPGWIMAGMWLLALLLVLLFFVEPLKNINFHDGVDAAKASSSHAAAEESYQNGGGSAGEKKDSQSSVVQAYHPLQTYAHLQPERRARGLTDDYDSCFVIDDTDSNSHRSNRPSAERSSLQRNLFSTGYDKLFPVAEADAEERGSIEMGNANRSSSRAEYAPLNRENTFSNFNSNFNLNNSSDVTINNARSVSDARGHYYTQLNDVDHGGLRNERATLLPHAEQKSWTARWCPCLPYITAEVYVILLLYIVSKAGQEMSVASIPLLTGSMFHWGTESAGYFMAVLGAMVLPTNVFINMFVKNVDDRDMLLWLSVVSILSIFCIVNLHEWEYSVFQYVAGTTLFFCMLNSLEGIMMALLSKLIAPELAKGTCNSGLLATEAGTLGRVIGDLTITTCAQYAASGPAVGSSSLVNLLYAPIVLGLILCLLVVFKYFDRLLV